MIPICGPTSQGWLQKVQGCENLAELTFSEARHTNAQVTANMGPQQKKSMRRMGLNGEPNVTRLGAGETIAATRPRESRPLWHRLRLSQHTACCILQDRTGSMWIGTKSRPNRSPQRPSRPQYRRAQRGTVGPVRK